MHKMTEDNLKAAFAGESQAHMKYLIFADVAQQEGNQIWPGSSELSLMPSESTPPTTIACWRW